MAIDVQTRRSFLKWTAGTAAGAVLPSWFAQEEELLALAAQQRRPRRIGPNDVIQVAVIGPGGSRGGFRQGLGVTRWMAGKQGVKVVAACDVDEVHLNEAAAAFGPETRKFKDYRELIAAGLVDAVVIGSPDHWHEDMCIDALKAGIHVYCEKPLTLTIQEGRRISEAAKRAKKAFQVGSQQRSDGRFRLACEMVRNGRIGQLKRVETRLPGGPNGGPFDPQRIPADLDWNLWLGPAPWEEYTFARTHGTFRWWLEYSGGMLTDWGAHHHDIAQWGMGMDDSGPVRVEATGTPPAVISRRHYSTFPAYRVEFKYASGITLTSTNEGENGVRFEGDDGWIFVSRGKIEASNPAILESALPSSATRLYKSDDHVQNFLDGVRTGKECICTAEVGHRSATICHLANISLRLSGRALDWDPVREVFPKDAEAQLMVDRPKRNWRKG